MWIPNYLHPGSSPCHILYKPWNLVSRGRNTLRKVGHNISNWMDNTSITCNAKGEKNTSQKKKEWLGSKREINNERLWPFLLSILLINLTQRERERERERVRQILKNEWMAIRLLVLISFTNCNGNAYAVSTQVQLF